MIQSVNIGRYFGIPIRVHITVLIILPLMALRSPFGLFWGILFAGGLFASITLHELGHSLVARAKGIHVTEIVLLPIGGMAKFTSMPSNPKDEMLIAAAGPAVNVLLAMLLGLCGMFFFMTLGPATLRLPLPSITIYLAISNVVLAIFNMLPSFPMDGGRIFRAWMTPRVGKVEATRRASKIGRIMAVAFGILGLYTGNIFLVMVAVFVYFAAAAEYKAVQFQEGFLKNFFGGATRSTTRPASSGSQAHYSAPPPPPKRSAASQAPRPTRSEPVEAPVSEAEKKRIKNVFDDLYTEWH